MGMIKDIAILGAIAIGGYLIYKKFLATTPVFSGGTIVDTVTSPYDALLSTKSGEQVGLNMPSPFAIMGFGSYLPTVTKTGKKQPVYRTLRPDTPKGRGIRIPSRPPAPEWTKSKDLLHVLARSKIVQSRPTESLYGTKKVYTSQQGTSIITRSGR